MADSHDRDDKVNDKIEAIGAVIGRNLRQTHHLLTRGEIKSATFAPSRAPTGVKAVYRTRTRRIVVRRRRRASRSIPVYVRRSVLLWSAVNGGVA
jgi:hypothetical protein